MKKLMIAAAIVCAAAFAQAASMNWGCDYTYASDGSGTAGEDRGTTALYKAYVFDALAYTTFAEDVAKDGIASVLANKSVDSWTMTSGFAAEGGINGVSGDVFSGTDSAKAFMVLIDGADIASAKNYFVSETQTAEIPAGQGLYGTFSFGDGGDLIASASAGNWKAMAVPEPTSGLLLLLGVAGLALKRKRA